MSGLTTKVLSGEGRALSATLSNALRETRVTPGEIFAPDYCDLEVGLRGGPRETLDEVVQHLRDLGYLKGRMDRDKGYKHELQLGIDHAAELEEALLAMYDELRAVWKLFDYKPAKGESGKPVNTFQDGVLERQLENPLVVKYDTIMILRALLTLDGSTKMLVQPGLGDVNLASRVIQHRLRFYGLLPDTTNTAAPWSEESELSLRGLCALLGQDISTSARIRGVVDAMGSFRTMTSRFAKQYTGVGFLVPAPGPEIGTLFAEQRELRKNPRWPQATLDFTGFENPTAKARVRSQFRQSWNYFGVRLVQISLWHAGFYLGEIDGLWGTMSQRAFVAALRDEGRFRLAKREVVVDGKKKLTEVFIPDFLSSLHQFYRLDVAGFLKSCVSKGLHLTQAQQDEHNPDTIFRARDEIEAHLDEMGATQKQKRDAWNQIFDKANQADETQNLKRRRKNFAFGVIGAGIAKIVKWVKSAARKIKEFIKNLLKRISGAVLHVFRFLKRGFGKVLKTARLALRRVVHFFSGKPYVSGVSGSRYVITKFSFDQDAGNYCGKETTSDDVNNHFRTIDEQNRALETVLRLGARIAKLMMLVTPPLSFWAWVRLAWKVFRKTWDFFRDLQSEWKKSGVEEAAPWRTGMLLTT